MPENLPSINLVGNRQISSFDKFINWALTIGRLIVILTEIIAVIAFVYRFSLDEKLSNLHTEINNKQAQLLTLRQDENKYRNLQERIELASTISLKSTRANKIIQDIILLAPPGVTINELTFSKDEVNLGLSANSVSSLTDFINPLKDYPEIKSISIDDIENKTSIGLLVNITATLK